MKIFATLSKVPLFIHKAIAYGLAIIAPFMKDETWFYPIIALIVLFYVSFSLYLLDQQNRKEYGDDYVAQIKNEKQTAHVGHP